MANKRMFSMKIVGSDQFIEMPVSSRELYFQIGMYADDDGFVSPRKIMRMIGASENDLQVLISKRFVIPFESGIIVVKHWKMNNEIKKDRYYPTQYKEEKQTLFLKENGAYTQDNTQGLPLIENVCIQSGTRLVPEVVPQIRLDKIRLDKINNNVRFAHPKLQEVIEYCKERGNSVDPEKWFSYYESNGWKVGRNAMKDWKAAVRTWEKSQFGSNSKQINNVLKTNNSNAIVEAMKKKIQKNEK